MEQLIQSVVKDQFGVDVDIRLTRPDAAFGDYATNVALQIARQLEKNPREVAEVIAEKLRQTDDFSGIEVAGPGFINIHLSDSTILGLLKKQPQPSRAGQTVVIETNNPNPFKAMHIGHAFNAVLGDTIANLLAVSGAIVQRVSYHGDVGLHVGKSMYSLLKYADGDFSRIETIPATEHNSFMSKMYAEGSKAYKEDEIAKREIDELAQESFAPQSKLYSQIYELCKKWSFEQIDATVKQLGNQPTIARFLESLADTKGVEVVKANVPDIFQESDGALIFKGSEHGAFDNAFVASNGRGLYAARDLGLMLLKNELFHPDKSYVITGGEQAAYFKGVIAAAGLVWPEQKNQTINIPTGLVKLTTGKMSSRDGDVVEIAWLFDEFKKAIEARDGEATDVIVAGALRYQFLRVKIGSDVVFDVNEAVSLTGNTGSYLQYAHARACSILAKANSHDPLTEIKSEDRALVRKLTEYSDVIERASNDIEPHVICTYLFELAQEFNRYYEANKIIGSDDETHRTALTRVYVDCLRAGLAILGIHAPEKM